MLYEALMSSGQWDLNALEALEREALEVVGVLEVPDHVRRCQPASPVRHMHHHSHAYHRHDKQQHPISYQLKEFQSTHPSHLQRGIENVASTNVVRVGSLKCRPTSVGSMHNKQGNVAGFEDGVQIELKDHIKHCSCTCNHMGYGNFMDYQQVKCFQNTNTQIMTNPFQTSCFGGLPDVTEHSHGAGQQLLVNHRHGVLEPSTITSQNPLIGCLSSTPQKIDLSMSIGPEHSCSQSPPLLSYQTVLDHDEKGTSNEVVVKCEHSSAKPFFGKSCIYIWFGLILAVCLLGSVGFFVTHLGFAYGMENQESYDMRVLAVKRLMRDSPLIGKFIFSLFIQLK